MSRNIYNSSFIGKTRKRSIAKRRTLKGGNWWEWRPGFMKTKPDCTKCEKHCPREAVKQETIPYINQIIRAINQVIRGINQVLNTLESDKVKGEIVLVISKEGYKID